MGEQTSAPRPAHARPVEASEPAAATSGWVMGLAVFAGVIMVMNGLFQVLQGFAALIEDKFYVAVHNYLYAVDVTAWGWVHLVWGALVMVAGFFVFTGRVWARIIGVVFATLHAVSQFLFIPYYPVWSLLMIVLDVAVIWALCMYGRGAAAQAERGRW